MGKRYHACHAHSKKSRVFRLISDRVHLATKKITKDKDEHYKMKKSQFTKKTQQS